MSRRDPDSYWSAGKRTPCSHEGCSSSLPDHAWGRIKAEGWFFQKDGSSWCPDHHPEWVAAWRARRDKERANDDSEE